jgi:hypothetical protein
VELTAEEEAFVEKRAKFAHSWPFVGSVMLAVVLGFGAWLWFSNPLLINPWAVLSGLDSDSIEATTITLMAGMLPLVMLTCLFLLVVALVLSFAAFANERRHIAIIRRLTAGRVEERATGAKNDSFLS